MKKLLVALLLIPSLAFAQVATRNDNAFDGTGYVVGNGNHSNSMIAVDSNGRIGARIVDPGSGETLSPIPVSGAVDLNGLGTLDVVPVFVVNDAAEAASTTTVIVATAHAARVGDIVEFISGTAANIGVWSYVSAVATNSITLGKALPATPAAADTFDIKRLRTRNPIYLEDSASASGDPGTAILGVVNATGTTFSSTGGDFTNIALNVSGGQQVVLDSNFSNGLNTNLLKIEDTATADGQTGAAVFARVKGDFAASAADGDYGHFNVDLDGRLAVNPWGADTSETGSSCGTATASTSDVAIKAAVASNRIYVGSITCSSSDADNATNINFKDGSTVVAVGGVSQMATASDGTFTATFNPPLRGTVNTAFNFNTAVSTSSVICCANWFTSGN